MQYAKQKASKALWGLVLCILCMFSAEVSWSQATQQFTGTVIDSTGAVIPEAQVVVHNQATGVDTKTVTTSSGAYTVTYLIPGTYNITVSKAGFASIVKTDILLNVDQTSTIDFKLAVGATSQVVSVNASETQIELTKSDRGEIIDNERIVEMPLDSRNPLWAFRTQPRHARLLEFAISATVRQRDRQPVCEWLAASESDQCRWRGQRRSGCGESSVMCHPWMTFRNSRSC